jgi:phospholipid/cholesterol/gamma-HCH transport system substrate-binding protein
MTRHSSRGREASRRTLRRSLAGLVGLVCAALALSGCKFDGAYDLPLPGHPVSKSDSYQITAEFKDILSVVPRSPVKVDDVTVGEVTDVRRVGWHASITMRVRNDVVLPDNAVADIRQVSLLGEKYVALEPPPDAKPVGRLSNGDDIPLSSTGRNPEVEEVLGALSFLLSGGGVGQIKTISVELNKVMSGRQDRLRHLLSQLDSFVGTIDNQKQDIIRALDSINNLSATLNREKRTLTAALDTLGPAIDVLRSQHAKLITMLRQLGRLGTVGTRVIGSTKDNMLADLAHLKPVLHKLNEAGQSLPQGLSLMISFPFPAGTTVVKGDYANTSIAMDVNLANFLKFYGLPNQQLPLPQVPGVPGL